MRNPLRSEADAFRMVVIIGCGAAAVIALALLTRPLFGALLAAALIGLGARLVWRGSRGTIRGKAEVAGSRDDAHRIMVIANETVGGRVLLREIANRCRSRRCEVLVVTPALTSQLKHWVSDVDGAIADAERRRDESVRAIVALGIDARGEVGDSEPNVAIEDALRTFPADELIISTHPPDRSKWLERGVVERARRDVELPIAHVVVDLESERPEVA
jgi:hypothetical protein